MGLSSNLKHKSLLLFHCSKPILEASIKRLRHFQCIHDTGNGAYFTTTQHTTPTFETELPIVLLWQLLTFVASIANIAFIGAFPMTSTLNIQLTNELRRYIDMRASDDDVYATPSEYIRDLVRRDMEEFAIVSDVVQGLREMKAGTFAKESILDILNKS